MKLNVIVRNLQGEFYGGTLVGTLRVHQGVKCRELVPQSLRFEVYKKVNKKTDIPFIKNFITVSEFRKKTKGKLPVKFSQILLDSLGFDRVWVFTGNDIV